MKLISDETQYKSKKINASLTVEASLVLPLFLFFFVSFLYFIQIIALQEVLQEAMTETSLSMARAAYIYSDFHDAGDAKTIDNSMLEEGIQIGLQEITDVVISNVVLTHALKSRLNKDIINYSYIVGGYDGIRFDESKILQGNDDIDIVARYRVRIPIRIFGLPEMKMIQRVKLRGWNGHQLPPLYTIIHEENEGKEKFVYITESGTVYHLSKTCSHIRLSIEEVKGKPTWQRNKNGGIYYPCESCCKNIGSESSTYYITSYGDRYHTNRACSKIKRTVTEVPLSDVGGRAVCKRCGR